MERLNLIGHTFGRLTVIAMGPPKKVILTKTTWRCRCVCGNVVVIDRSNLRSGVTKSCGCLQREVTRRRCTSHGLSHRREYKIWVGMKKRCYNPRCPAYRHYGGRGIAICDRWRDNFQAFFEDMGPCPTRTSTIERENVNGPYSLDNCVWAAVSEQGKNTRRRHALTMNGETHSLAEWQRRTGIGYSVMIHRLKRGWTVQRVLTTPTKPEQE